jgi:hypothetical protein
MMKQPTAFGHLSANLDRFNEIRAVLSANGRAKLLIGGNDKAHIYREIIPDHPNWFYQFIHSIPTNP